MSWTKSYRVEFRRFFVLLISLTLITNSLTPVVSYGGPSSENSGGPSNLKVTKELEELGAFTTSAPGESPEVAVHKAVDAALENRQLFDENIRTLDEVLRGLRAGVHPLDPWGALSSRMVHHSKRGRRIPIPKEKLQVILGDYTEVRPALSKDRMARYLSWIFDARSGLLVDENGQVLPPPSRR